MPTNRHSLNNKKLHALVEELALVNDGLDNAISLAREYQQRKLEKAVTDKDIQDYRFIKEIIEILKGIK